MKKNITMSIDEEVFKKARKITVDKDTTVTGLVRNYLNHLLEQKQQSKEKIVSQLNELLEHSDAVVGEKNAPGKTFMKDRYFIFRRHEPGSNH